jgi:hypothetical protein
MHYTICDYILDLTQNSIEAGSSIINLDIHESTNKIEVSVSDNGKGMDAEKIKKAQDPFYTDTETIKHKRKIGLGIPFILQNIEQTNGTFAINSSENIGTTVKFSFDKNNFDTPPIGDKVTTYLSLMSYPGDYDLLIKEEKNNQNISFHKKELEEILGNLNSASNLKMIMKYLQDNII